MLLSVVISAFLFRIAPPVTTVPPVTTTPTVTTVMTPTPVGRSHNLSVTQSDTVGSHLSGLEGVWITEMFG